MQASRDRCRSAILEIIMIVSLWVGRRGAPSKVGFDHVGEEVGDLGISCIGHVAEPRAFAGSSDCGEISLGAVPRSVGAVAVGPAAAFVGLHQRTAHDLLDRGKAAYELVATLAQGRG